MTDDNRNDVMSPADRVLQQAPAQVAPQAHRTPHGADVDLQVQTAKAYPRQLRAVLSEAVAMATISEGMAEACIYSYRRGGKDIVGPSVRLAEIVMTTWGNLRCSTEIVAEEHKHVTARGTVWDMEKNVLIQADSRRSIWGNSGRYSADMIAVTANAAASIALRNAIFRVVPRAIVEEIYGAARDCAFGNMKSMSERRQAAIETFNRMGVSTERIMNRLELHSELDMTMEHLEILTGIRTRLKQEGGTLEDEFPELPTPKKEEKKPEEKPAGGPRDSLFGKGGER